MNIGLIYTSDVEENEEDPTSIDIEGRMSDDHIIEIDKCLKSKGHDTVHIHVDLDMFEKLRKMKDEIDVIFNLCDDGFFSKSSMEPHVPAMLDILAIPYTGAGYKSLATCLNKGRTKEILQANDIPTPKFQVFDSMKVRLNTGLKFPLFVKPVREDASIGIKQDSIVHDEEELMRRVFIVLDMYKQPALVEEFIDGREANVGIIGTKTMQALPVSEIIFDHLSDDLPKICTYSAKWKEESDYFKNTPPKCPAEMDEQLANKLKEIALKSYKLMGCQDYGRVDFRIDKQGNPYVLEVNPNPDISFDAGLARMAKAAGKEYPVLIDFIVNSALEKFGVKPKINITVE
ncbi:ATP-grasp domain-containing protein [Nanoarchaeota archaeon]